MNVTEYQLIGAEDATSLNDQVNDLIAKGYQPHGSPYFAGGFHMQAMVKMGPW